MVGSMRPTPSHAPQPVCVIVNSTSGRGCDSHWVHSLQRQFEASGAPAEVVLVKSGEEILQAATAAIRAHAPAVVAAGGDGTVSAVASRLAGTDVPLGVVPMGTLNHFAKDLGIPLALEAAVSTITEGHQAAVDAAEVNGRLFINNSSLGLYPDIVLDRERQRRRLGRGKWRALLAASVHAARKYPVLALQLELDGKRWERQSAFVFVGNNEYQMEGFEIGERASLSDGRLSLYVTQRTGRFGLLRLALRALTRRLRQARDFDIVTARSLTVRTPHQHMRVATDGEVNVMRTPLEYRVRPGALKVFVPVPAPRRNEQRGDAG